MDLAQLLDEMTPYIVSALGAYGESVLEKEKASSLSVGVGLGLSQRIFGKREEGDSIPDALAKVVKRPTDPKYAADLRALIRDKLEKDSALADDVKQIIAEAKEAKAARRRATSPEDRSVDIHAKARTIATGNPREKR